MLARDPGAYHQEIVEVETLGTVISDGITENYLILFAPGCSELDAWTTVKLQDWSKLGPEVDEFINNPKPEYRDGTVVVVGRFDQRFSLGCFAPKFGIWTTSVELVSSVTSRPLPEMPKQSSH